MEGVTTALVAFLLVCVVFPNLVKNRAQYYSAFAAVCLIILLDAIGVALRGKAPPMTGFSVFAYVAIAGLQVAAILLLFLACGGITWRELADDMARAYEIIRRGREDKEIVIPLSGEMGRKRQQQQRAAADPVETHERIVINDPTIEVSPPPAAEPIAPEVEPDRTTQ